LERLPVDDVVPSVDEALDAHRAVVVVAPPGAGKTTRIPPELTRRGRVLLLQPRRAAARAIARRVAAEQSWTLGREVGWQVRFEHRFTAETRLLVATEGILTARLQRDPLLSDFSAIVIDEFHERSVHADLGIALARQAWRARSNLRLIVMSATLDAENVAAFLDDCPIIRVEGRAHPIQIDYTPAVSPSDSAIDLLRRTDRHVLCFLQGAAEIQRVVNELRGRAPEVEVLPLHGSLSAGDQDLALTPSSNRTRRIVVATNLAETSVTVPGVVAVVDAGLQKVARYDAGRGIDSLETERIPQDAADQRAGRAGRERAGVVRRLWAATDRLRPNREAEIHRVDLAGIVLDILGWGGRPDRFEWFDAPSSRAVSAALDLLTRLDAVSGSALTATGREMLTLPVHPRLARMLIAARGAQSMVRACAVLSERLYVPSGRTSTTSDLLSAIDDWDSMPPHVHQLARDLERLTGSLRPAGAPHLPEEDFRRAVLAGYPDRVGERREAGSPRLKLASGTGAAIAGNSGVGGGDFVVALDVRAPARPGDPDNRVMLASQIERAWLEPTSIERVHRLDEGNTVRAMTVARYDALVLAETPSTVDSDLAAELLADAWLSREPPASDATLVRRLAWAGIAVELRDVARAASAGKRTLADVHLVNGLGRDVIASLERLAPERLTVPSGRTVALEYDDHGSVSASVKLQELFGLAETPRVGARREPVRLHLLAPNGRPVQTTRDLRSFWEHTYPEVRNELRGRYPKHPWPVDPWGAPPTAGTTRSRRR
jgi:ATP-dependent helicase HrpB